MLKQLISKLFCRNHSFSTLQKSCLSSLTRTTAVGVQPPCHQGNCNYGNFKSQFNTFTESLQNWQFSGAPTLNLTFIRTSAYYAYRPNALKRIKKHGLEKRLSCRSQREILFRKIIKGKKVLTVFDRFTNIYPEKVDKTKRVNLFDPKRGFRKFIQKPEYFRFA
ncbi:hypothetical protein DPMN_056153 [Dreissena polymorpha]|uniref:Uncharacterized protein n=1 Tax=Dreissena polymorpha TaxID=45954 RepID=A0A9D4CS09_DREPO|nr:hypothetical protein DPMN_056153 [Dreissena polymorpha]